MGLYFSSIGKGKCEKGRDFGGTSVGHGEQLIVEAENGRKVEMNKDLLSVT